MGYDEFGQFPPEVHANYVNLPQSCMGYGELEHAKYTMLIVWFLVLVLV